MQHHRIHQHANVAEFEFPNENLVIYLCNPFSGLRSWRACSPTWRSRSTRTRGTAVMILLWPERSRQIAEMRHMKPYELNRRFHIYQTANPGASLVTTTQPLPPSF